MISVIVPVYKAEKNLEQCVQSILCQTYADLELILVDDGSPDCSGTMCDEYAKQDERVVVIHKENGGAASARNMGLKAARGEYIMFCDADDTLTRNALEVMSSAIKASDVQMVVGDFEYILINSQTNAIQSRKSIIREHKEIELGDSEEMLFFWKSNNMLSSCAKLYRADIICKNSITFNTDLIVMEDYAFVIDYLSCCKKICMIPELIYQYYTWADSPITERRARLDFFDDVIFVSNRLTAYLSGLHCDNIDAFQKQSIYEMLHFAFRLLWSIQSPNQAFRRKKHKRIKKAMSEDILQKMIDNDKDHLHPIEYFCYKHRSVYGILAFRFIQRFI